MFALIIDFLLFKNPPKNFQRYEFLPLNHDRGKREINLVKISINGRIMLFINVYCI
tara:strand:+ start:47 stop:214 length:168 start_codon:yes stop_codon:yes gene_type:complete